jgi:hypothetical protein
MTTTLSSPVTIPYPAVAGDLELRIQGGACRLRVTPADQDAFVTGSYMDPSGSINVTSQTDGNRVTVRVGRSGADFFGLLSGIPELNLEIGKARPFALTVEAGASESHIDLGGLPITRLNLSHGAGAFDVTFSAPNPAVMSELKLSVGAGRTDAHQLGNANFQSLLVEGGAASYTLDFSGAALKNASARISTAMASVQARIPSELAAQVTSENMLGQTRAEPGFTWNGRAWLSRAATEGKPIQLRIHSAMVMGQLQLRS